jgi:hypothetical protein
MYKLIPLLFLAALACPAADTYDFGLLPANGAVQGAPGSTVGWGYSLHNQSSSLWLVPVDLSASGAFSNGSALLMFEFPALAPTVALTEYFHPNISGLYQLTWNANAPIGFTDSGTFTLDAQWWTGDPANGGVLVAGAGTTQLHYSATVVSSAVPEPSTAGIAALSMGSLLAAAAVRRRARRAAAA